ncbi:MAG: insulinase family protein [Deltaproteobacteria bacterium]|nr:insulinase family protein [Deltaproteobacteria bacterium]
MTETQGFELLKERDIPEIGTRARHYRHTKTGAEVLSLENDDENKVFGITFRTPPSDSTGVAHILEHSVLCGSRKYPVKEPFVEILKGSLQTFLNAFTYPDKTCYPVASQNIRDFYNLIDVYLDAVFYPRIEPHVFKQEGWHYDLEEKDLPLQFKGVVFNEMKGAYSSPERLLGEYSQQSLFPDTPYGLDSGGDPSRIPELTFDAFQDFHRRFYHPSNALIFFHGDDDPEERLRLVNKYLKDFEKSETDSSIAVQRDFGAPRKMERSYASGPDETGRNRGMVTVNWLLTETPDLEMNMALHILSYILLGTPGSPLRKALIDSGLGEDLAGGGLEDELQQLYFSIGLKGIDPGRAIEVEKLILDTLASLVRNGIEPDAVEAAINTTEFTLRENNTGSHPRGLILMLRSLTTWLHGADPIAPLAFETPLEAIKNGISRERGFFERILSRWFIDNNHRTTVILRPDPDLEERESRREREVLAGAKERLSAVDVDRLVKDTKELKNIQATPDTPEALSTIPMLRLSDLELRNKVIPLEISDRQGIPLLYHDLSTGGILYLDIGFSLRALPEAYLPFVPLFSRALFEMGTEKEDFVQLSRRIDRKTGGIYASSLTSPVRNSPETESRLFIRGKAVCERVDDMLDIVRDVLFSIKLDDRDRFRQMVLEEKARQEHAVVPAGHQFVGIRLHSHFGTAGWVGEQMAGISYLSFLRDLAGRVETDWPSILAVLTDMLHLSVNRAGMIVNATVDGKEWTRLEPSLARFMKDMPDRDLPAASWVPQPPDPFEAMVVPSQINYVGKGYNLYSLGYKYHGSVGVITRYLRNSWLWDMVRVQGGAYGAFCTFDRLSGDLLFLSYRDPNVKKTIDAFDGAAGYLRDLHLSDGELTKGIIGTIGNIDTYLFPDAKGYTSMVRHLVGSTEEERQRTREEVLSTTASDFRTFADVLEQVAAAGLVKVLGSKEALQKGAEESGIPFHIISVL